MEFDIDLDEFDNGRFELAVRSRYTHATSLQIIVMELFKLTRGKS